MENTSEYLVQVTKTYILRVDAEDADSAKEEAMCQAGIDNADTTDAVILDGPDE